MSEYSLYDVQIPDLVENNEGVRQLVFYPTPETPGRCLTFSEIDVPTSADLFDNACNTPTGVGGLLSQAGVTLQHKAIWSQKITQFNFPHPSVLDTRLQAIAIAHPDFTPPRFEAFDEERYSFDELASYLGRNVMPLATRGYSTVHDYEGHVPTLMVMCPELFEAVCEQSKNVHQTERSDWMKRMDTLTQLGAFGSLLASTIETDLRAPIIHWLEENTSFSTQDAIRLGYHSENYRREIIAPVVKHLSQ